MAINVTSKRMQCLMHNKLTRALIEDLNNQHLQLMNKFYIIVLQFNHMHTGDICTCVCMYVQLSM